MGVSTAGGSALCLEQDLGVPVNVVNVTGGGGVTGHRYGARARPDGYTLTMMTVELNMLHWRNLTHLSWKDFKPIALINQDAASLFAAGAGSRWTNLASLEKYISENPGQLTASGTATVGSGTWLWRGGGESESPPEPLPRLPTGSSSPWTVLCKAAPW